MELPSGYDICCSDFELEMEVLGLGMDVDFPRLLLFCLHCEPKPKQKIQDRVNTGTWELGVGTKMN